MALHHRPEMENMRSLYNSSTSQSTKGSDQRRHRDSSSVSQRLHRTQLTHDSNSFSSGLPHSESGHRLVTHTSHCFPDQASQERQRKPEETCAQDDDSDDEAQEDGDDECVDYKLPQYVASGLHGPTAVPATPSDFSDLFPSRRRLTIRHDDTTLDGNMNLRLDTEVTTTTGQKCEMTLFHLRMHDLKTREFSLRRYCRDSGREVCSSARKSRIEKRPGFKRSFSNAINTIRQKSDPMTATLSSLKRHDSGYGSMESVNSGRIDRRSRSASHSTPEKSPSASTPIKLEFSNYAQVEVKRSGMKGNKRYEFDYWGTHYAWKRISCKESKWPSFHLTKTGSDEVLAYIVPSELTELQELSEHNKGGWVPSCSIWVANEGIIESQKDVSDVVIASGLMALVDDAIYAHFHGKGSVRLHFPGSAGSKRVLHNVFRRRSNSRHSTSSASRRPSTSDS